MNRVPSSSLRLSELLEDTFRAESELAVEWPHPDYADAAKACGKDAGALEKLARLCEDLEAVVNLNAGPASLLRLARVSYAVLQPLDGRCWREVITDDKLDAQAWEGIKQYARVLRSQEMDSGTRRVGVLLHAVALIRLQERGVIEHDPEKRKRHGSERALLLDKPYLPRFVADILQKY